MRKPVLSVGSGITRADIVERLRRQLGVRGQPSLELRPDVQPVVVAHDLTDTALVDDPVYWAVGALVTAAAGRVPSIYLQGRAPRTTVDGIIVTVGAASQISIRKVGTSAAATRQSQVLNRGNEGAKFSVAQLTAVEQDVAAFLNADEAAVFQITLNTPYMVPLPPMRLVPKPDGSLLDTIEIQGNTIASLMMVTAWGREYRE